MCCGICPFLVVVTTSNVLTSRFHYIKEKILALNTYQQKFIVWVLSCSWQQFRTWFVFPHRSPQSLVLPRAPSHRSIAVPLISTKLKEPGTPLLPMLSSGFLHLLWSHFKGDRLSHSPLLKQKSSCLPFIIGQIGLWPEVSQSSRF